MARKRWVYRNGEAIEVGGDYTQPKNYDHLLYNDRLYQDDGDARYHSRKSHAEFMKRNDLAIASDFKDTWAEAAKSRDRFAKGIDPERREHIARAVHQHLDRSR